MIKESYEIKLVIFSRNKLFIFFVWVCLYYIVIVIVPWKWEGLKQGCESFTFLPADPDPLENALKFKMSKSEILNIASNNNIIKLERELYLNLASEQGNKFDILTDPKVWIKVKCSSEIRENNEKILQYDVPNYIFFCCWIFMNTRTIYKNIPNIKIIMLIC